MLNKIGPVAFLLALGAHNGKKLTRPTYSQTLFSPLSLAQGILKRIFTLKPQHGFFTNTIGTFSIQCIGEKVKPKNYIILMNVV